MVSASEWHDVDRLIGAALQVNGRAPWGVLARVLDIPERTVARRGQRLLDMGAVRVSTYLDTTRVGDAHPLIIQVATVAGAALRVARVLAHREDASSVSVLEGSGDVICMLVPRSPEASTNLLLHELPEIDGIISTEASTVLRYFRSGYDWYGGKLPSAVVEQLRADVRPLSAPVSTPAERVTLSPDDEQLIARLAEDGRSTVTTLARDLGATAQTIRRRLDSLFAAGALHVRTEVAPSLLGLGMEAISWLRLPADEIEPVGLALGKHPAVRFCAASTGGSQLFLDCLVEDAEELYQFLTQDVAQYASVTIVRSSVVLMPVRRGPMTVLPELPGAEEADPRGGTG